LRHRSPARPPGLPNARANAAGRDTRTPVYQALTQQAMPLPADDGRFPTALNLLRERFRPRP
jgi:hypothetical protein